MSIEQDSTTHWHLDKKVPISIIVALFVQFSGGVWFMAKMESRVVANESRMIALESIAAAAKTSQERVDEQQDQRAGEAVNLVRSDIHELGRKLDRLVERNPRP